MPYSESLFFNLVVCLAAALVCGWLASRLRFSNKNRTPAKSEFCDFSFGTQSARSDTAGATTENGFIKASGTALSSPPIFA